jgi:integrase
MRRNEVLGLKWPDIDFAKKRLHLNRGLVAVGYEVYQTRGKTKSARREIALDDTTSAPASSTTNDATHGPLATVQPPAHLRTWYRAPHTMSVWRIPLHVPGRRCAPGWKSFASRRDAWRTS